MTRHATVRWLLAAVVIAAVGLVTVVAVGASPERALAAAVEAAVGSPVAVQETLAKTVPLLLCGLAVALAFRAGVWNIGAEGQLLAGATVATWAVLWVPAGPWSVAVGLGAGLVAGAAWAGIAALLRAVSGVNEVLSTILLNLVAQALLGWAVHGPLAEKGGAYPQSDALPEAARLWRPFPPGRLHLGLLVAALVGVAVWLLLRRTRWGLAVRATGDNAEAARIAGVRTGRVQAQALLLSGAIAGLAGAVEVAGITFRLFERFSPGWGYSGIAVALLGGLEPSGTAGAALLFGALSAGSGGMQRVAGVPAVATLLLQGTVVVALAVRMGRGRR